MVHSQDFSFKCDVCNKAFKTEQYLTTHKRTHSSIKPYVCPVASCQLRFKRSDFLKRHLLLHEPTKRFKCSFHALLGCRKTFSRKDKLKEHILTHYKSDRTICDICGKDLKRFSVLIRHRKQCAASQGEADDSATPSAKRPALKTKQETSIPKCFDESAGVDDNVPTIEIVVMPVNKRARSNRKTAAMKFDALSKDQICQILSDASSLGNLSESVDSVPS